MATITVTNLNDNGAGSLRQAIADAGPGDTIDFAAGLTGGTLTLTSGELAITTDVTIDGDITGDGAPDITIEGGFNIRPFDISAGNATLNGLAITGGSVSSNGGGVYVGNGAGLAVTDSTISGNSAVLGGGGLFNNGGTVTLTNTTVEGNTGGYGGGIDNHSGTLALTNAAVIYNIAEDGGDVETDGGAVTMTNTTLAGGFARQAGGAVFSNGGTTTLTSTTLTGNYGVYSGGAIYAKAGTLTLTNSIAVGNAAPAGHDVYTHAGATVAFRGPSLIGSSPDGSGTLDTSNGSYTRIDGASQSGLQQVFADIGKDAETHVLSGLLFDNGGLVPTAALNPAGVAIGAGSTADLPADTQDLNHNNSTSEPLPVDARSLPRVTGISLDLGAFQQQAPQSLVVTTLDDGAVTTNPDLNNLSLREALFLANQDPTDGDTITFAQGLAGGTLYLTQGQLDISGNVTIDGDINGDGTPDITISADSAAGANDATSRVFKILGSGGAPVSAALDGLVIEDGYAGGASGGNIFVYAGDSLSLDGTTVKDGKSFDQGGGIYARSYTSVTLTNSTVAGNYGLAGGGGVRAGRYSSLTLTNSSVTENTSDQGSGGGLYAGKYTAATLTNTTLAGNYARFGGGLYGFSHNTFTFNDSTVTGNKAEDSGGGVYVFGSSSVTTLANSIVAGNAGFGNDLFGGATPSPLVLEGHNIIGSTPADFSSINTTNGSYTKIDGTSSAALQTVFAQVGNNPGTGVLSGLPANNGGPVETVALNLSGIAVDAGVTADLPVDAFDLNHNGNSTEPLPVDARGAARVSGASVDIGAFEAQATPTNLVVSTLDDESYDGGDITAETADGNGLSLREALTLANDAGGSHTITFDPTLYGGTLTLSLGQLVIGSDVTIDGDIDGNGTADITIDGNGASRVFAAQAGTLTLDGLVVFDGSADLGGGLRIYGGASVDVTDSYISGNNASNSGGGIYVAPSGVLALNSSQVGRNIAAYGGGIDIASGSATINNSNIYLNTGYSDGGGIRTNAHATIALTNATVSDNTTSGSGGGIYATGGGLLDLTNATLTGNHSAAEGGAIFGDHAAFQLTNSTLTGNYASSGGGLYAQQAFDVTLANSIAAGNAASSAAAGYDLVFSSSSGAKLHFSGHNVIGSTPADPAAVDTSNGSYTQIDGTSQTDLQKVFAEVGRDPNTGVLSGVLANNGGVVATVALNPTGIAVDSGVTADAVYDADSNPVTPDVPIPTDARGFSRVAGSSVDIGAFEQQAPQSFVVTTLNDELDSTNANATIADMGGPNDLSLREALFLANEDPTTADTITFANDLSAGTIDLTLGQLQLFGGVTIDGDINGNNTPAITIDAEGSSRVIDALYGTSTINGLAMTDGYGFTGGAVKVGSLSGYGSADVTISNSAITGNNAAYGGGIAVNYGSSLQLTNTYVATNYAYLVGGGIANQGSLTLTNSIVNDNTSGYIGGGIASDNTLTVIGSTLSNNKTGGVGPGLPPHYYYRGGGGLYNSGSARLINTTISGNKGGYAGGGIYNSEDLTLINVTLANNSADYGGGLSNAACGCGNVSIDDTTITGNAATGHYGGGGIANAGGTLTLANSIVAGNGAPGQGPDIYAYAAITYSGVNLFSQLGIGRLGTDIYVSPSDLAQVFNTLTTIDPDGVPNSGDEFLAGTLANNGGPVETVLIKERGAAQNTGDNTALPLDPDNPGQQLPADARGETRVFDGTVDIGALELQVLLTPVVTAASNINASASENFTPSQLFSASTSVGDPIVSYEVQDETSGPNNGFWVLNGAVLPNGQIVTLSAAQLAELSFVAGSDSAPVSDTLEVAAANAAGQGAFTTFTVTAAPHETSAPPVVTAANELQPPDLTLAASSLFSATASGGNSIASYEVEDTTAGSGHWEFNGVAEPTNQVVYVTAAQLSQLNFVTGYGSDTLMVRANDGSQWGSFTSFTVTAPPNPPPPPGTSADLITFRPATGDYAIYDFVHNATPAVHLLTDIPAPWQTVGLGNFSGSGTSDMLLRNTTTGVFEIVDVSNNNASAPILLGAVGLEWQVAGFGDFSSHPGETDMLMRNVNNGNFELYDFSNNNVPFATALSGAVGLNQQVFGFGDFSGKPNETDMLMRDVNTDIVELVDFSNNAVTSVTQLGALGLEWQFAGAGDFSSRPGETDLLARNANNGDFELYDFQNGQVTAAIALGNAGLEWQVAGFADFSGNPNETDMLMRNTNTGQFEVVDFSNNAVSAVVLLGDVGLEWQVVGTAPFQATAGATAASDQSLSHSASSAASDPLGASDWLTQAMQAGGAANQPAPAGMGMGAAPAAGTSPVSGPGFDAGSDLLAGAAPAASLAMANPLQPHTG
ncbi:MAG TPA: right-handed parallel beta-helix repeat-containing protein [Xanthobacteraceae bacterium]|nr:right-handed parallel beta-helix repeat-containing protein [Xanthobacteraceae bacterium]